MGRLKNTFVHKDLQQLSANMEEEQTMIKLGLVTLPVEVRS